MSFSSIGDLFDEAEPPMEPRQLVIPDSEVDSEDETSQDGTSSEVSEAPERGRTDATTMVENPNDPVNPHWARAVSYTHLTLPTKA